MGGHLDLGVDGSAWLDVGGDGALTVEGDLNEAINAGAVSYTNIGYSGAVATIEGDDNVGVSGNAQDSIFNGGALTVSGAIDIGESADGVGALNVSGAGTVVTYGGALTVGKAGEGILNVENGANVSATPKGPGEIDIAAQSGATGSVTVDGDGSELSGQTLVVGGTAAGAGGAGYLTISDQGVVTVTDATVTGAGEVTLAGGSLETDPLTIDSGGTITGYGTITGDIANDGGVTADGGLLDLTGNVTGDYNIDSGASLELDQNANGASIDFRSGGQESLLLGGSGAQPPDLISDFSITDRIVLQGWTGVSLWTRTPRPAIWS